MKNSSVDPECVCVFVCVYVRASTHTHTHTHIRESKEGQSPVSSSYILSKGSHQRSTIQALLTNIPVNTL